MKNFHILLCFTALLGLFSNAGCKKEPVVESTLPPYTPPPPPQLPSNTAPTANAGIDIVLILPLNFCWLYGSASSIEPDIKSYAWKKISGPSAYILERPGSPGPTVSNLEKGMYEFELTVTDTAGLTGTDTTTITVGEISSNPTEIFFNNLSWGNEGLYGGLLWGSVVLVTNIYTYLPVGNVFKVYIQRDGSLDWVEVVQLPLDNELYGFALKDGKLVVYSDFDETDTPNLKIVY